TGSFSAESLDRAIELAHKSILLDEGRAEPHALLGHLYFLKRDWNRAIAEGEKGMALNPKGEDVTYWYAATLTYAGRAEEAILLLEKEIRRNPFAPSRYFLTYGDALRVRGRFDQAVSAYKKSIQREPNAFMARLSLAATYSMMGLEKAARSEVEEVLRLKPGLSLDSLEKMSAFKDPTETEKLFSALRKAGTPDKPLPPQPEKPSIMVMPFATLDNGMSQEVFAEGLTEEITTALSKIHELNVVAEKFSFMDRGEPGNGEQASRRLGGQYQLQGSVRQSADKFRITAQLVDAATGNHIWGERYDREGKDIFSIQDEITMKIVSALQVHLTEGEQARYYGKGATSLDAYLKFLTGRHLALSLKQEDNIKARKLATGIIDLHPNYHAGYTLLALIELQDVRLGFSKSPVESLKRSAELSRQSTALEDIPFPHTILARIDVLMRNYDEALEKAEKAFEMDPNCADACMTLGHVLMMMDKADEAVPVLEKAVGLMPYPLNNCFHNLAWAYVVSEKYEEAITAAQKAIRIEPNDILARLVLVCSYSFLDQQAEARSEAERVLRINPNWSVDESEKWLALNNKDKVRAIHNAYRGAGLK
ncbi:MAG: tetratricopeptide repeat protein, partial [Deltaproteobacteria bacterium]|nr:tetratricopeptide repeat protein [Deltaproteobacteria bacterium]